MGREIKRVAIDFDHPVGQVWPGYCMPAFGETCPFCKGSGRSEHGHYLSSIASQITLGGSYPNGHPNMAPNYDRPFGRGCGPGAKWAELSGALAGRMPEPPFGHDSSDRWRVESALIKAAGLPEDWARCKDCDGTGESNHEQAEAQRNAWEKTEPPAGDAYQVWETTSEGSPITPPFATPEELARFCADEGVSTFGSMTMDYERWLAFIRGPGWAPSMVVGAAGMQSGAAFIANTAPKPTPPPAASAPQD